MAGISKRAWLGLAAEVAHSPSNTLALVPTVYAPSKSEMKFMRATAVLDEDRGTRDENYGLIYGIRHADITMKSALYFESAYYPIMSAIGTDAVTGPVTGAYTHTATWADTPRTLTVFQSYDTAEYYSGNAMTEKFAIKVAGDGKFVDFDASLKGLYPVKQGTPDTPNFFSPAISNPAAGYYPTITFDGGGTSTDVMDFEFGFEQKLRLWTPIANSPDYVHIYPGARKAHVSFTLRFDADTYFQNWTGVTNGTKKAMTFDVKGDLIGGTAYNELNINIPVFQFTDIEIDKSKEDVVIKAKGDLISQSTGLFTLVMTNTVVSYAT